MTSLEEKVIIITGAASGIGAASARILSPFNPKIVFVSKSNSSLNKVLQECISIGLKSENSLLVCCDIEIENERKELIQKTIDKFHRIDVLINSTVIGVQGGLMDINLTTFDNDIRTNLKIPFRMIQLCVPYLSKVQGTVVNISSIYGQKVCRHSIMHGLSMAALDHLTRSAARELAAKKIRVNSVNPGYTEYDLAIEKEKSEVTTDEVIQREEINQPLTSVISLRDVAKVVKFLASDDSKTITGEVLVVDGGRSGVKQR